MPTVDGQHKTHSAHKADSTVFLQTFCLLVLCLGFFFFLILTGLLLVSYSFWFCVFMDFICVCVSCEFFFFVFWFVLFACLFPKERRHGLGWEGRWGGCGREWERGNHDLNILSKKWFSTICKMKICMSYSERSHFCCSWQGLQPHTDQCSISKRSEARRQHSLTC